MLFILLSWLYIFVISSIIGVSFIRLFNLKKLHSVIVLSIGLFGTTILTSLYAIWFPIDGYFQILLVSVCFILIIINNSLLLNYIGLIKLEFRSLSRFMKFLFGFIFILILAQCASPPFIIDNESYYIQTIKWLNEFGYVKGLVNLHLFLGQTSGWHLLQSAFNFSFIYDRFNDLSGFILLVGNYYALSQLNTFIIKKDKTRITLAIGLFPVFNVFFFQFISAPSPDIAIYVFALFVFHQFILCYKTYNKSLYLSITILVLFMISIKPTALTFCLLPIILFKRYYVFTRSTKVIVISLTTLAFTLIIIKNIIITGNAFFPLKFTDNLQVSWSLPSKVQTYFSLYGKAFAYHISPDNFESTSWFLRLKSWFFATGLHGIFNKMIIGLLFVMPLIIKKFYNQSSYWLLYGLSVFTLVLLMIFSPQYRFYFPFVMVFSLLILALIVLHKKSIQVGLMACTLFAAIPLVFELNNQKLTTNTNHNITSQFKLDYCIQPYPNSKFTSDYSTISVEKLRINTPTEIDFFWATGNVPIPALNQKQLDYFRTYFEVIPQQYSDDLKEGYYSKIIENE